MDFLTLRVVLFITVQTSADNVIRFCGHSMFYSACLWLDKVLCVTVVSKLAECVPNWRVWTGFSRAPSTICPHCNDNQKRKSTRQAFTEVFLSERGSMGGICVKGDSLI